MDINDELIDKGFGQSYDHELANREVYTQEGIKEGIKQGIEQGIEQERLKYISKLLDKNFDIDTISDLTGIEIDKVKEIIESINNK